MKASKWAASLASPFAVVNLELPHAASWRYHHYKFTVGLRANLYMAASKTSPVYISLLAKLG